MTNALSSTLTVTLRAGTPVPKASYPLSVNCGQKTHKPGISWSVICGQQIHMKFKNLFLGMLWSVICRQKIHIKLFLKNQNHQK